jgi:hypothetical protein
MMAVKADQHPVGLPPRFLDPAQVVLDVGDIRAAGRAECSGLGDARPEYLQFATGFLGRFRVGVKMRAVALAGLLETETFGNSLQGLEGFVVNRIGRL